MSTEAEPVKDTQKKYNITKKPYMFTLAILQNNFVFNKNESKLLSEGESWGSTYDNLICGSGAIPYCVTRFLSKYCMSISFQLRIFTLTNKNKSSLTILFSLLNMCIRKLSKKKKSSRSKRTNKDDISHSLILFTVVFFI